MGHLQRGSSGQKLVPLPFIIVTLFAHTQCAFSPPRDLIKNLASGRTQPSTSSAPTSDEGVNGLYEDGTITWIEHATGMTHVLRVGRSGSGTERFEAGVFFEPSFNGSNISLSAFERGILLVDETGVARYAVSLNTIYAKVVTFSSLASPYEIRHTSLNFSEGIRSSMLFSWEHDHNANEAVVALGPQKQVRITYQLARGLRAFPSYSLGSGGRTPAPQVSFESSTVQGEGCVNSDGIEITGVTLSRGSMAMLTPGSILRVTKMANVEAWDRSTQLPATIKVASAEKGKITLLSGIDGPVTHRLKRIDFLGDCLLGIEGFPLVTIKANSYVDFGGMSEVNPGVAFLHKKAKEGTPISGRLGPWLDSMVEAAANRELRPK
jgi:hypothetical protein